MIQKKKLFTTQNSSILLILFCAFAVRLYKITTPPLDWHSFRQADTASVTRNYVENGIDLLHPTYHDLSNIASGKENPQGYRMVEFPLLNAVSAAVVLLFNLTSVDVVSRLVSVVLSLGTLIFLFALTQKISGKRVALITLIIGSFFPYFVFYSRTILPEAGVVFFSTGALYFFYSWCAQKKWWQYMLSAVLLTFGLLLKPFVLFLFPVFFAIWFTHKRAVSSFFLTLFLLGGAVIPLLWWRNWIQNYPEGIPASNWLFNGNGIRLRPAWFRWLFYERMTKLMLGFVGSIFLPISLFKLKKSELYIYGAWLFGIISYLIIIATGNVQHDYYQNLLVPILLISVARGACMAEAFLRKKFTPAVSLSIVSLLVIFSLTTSWRYVKEFYIVNHWEYVRAGAAVDRLTPLTSKVIAPAFGDTQFLYQTKRSGWPIGYSIDEKIKLGATHYVTTSKDDEANELKKRFTIIEETNEYILIDLTQPKK